MNQFDKVLVLGASGLVGSAIVRSLIKNQYSNILTPPSSELNLLNQQSVLNYFAENKPDHVFLAAAKVGGIHANNTYRADFIWENLCIQNNVFQACFVNQIKKLLFLGSSCVYPKHSQQPITEDSLLTGPLEITNEPYAIAKIAGLKTAESYRKQYGCSYYSLMPTNLYGPNDNYHPENSHVIPGLISRMHVALKNNDSSFEVWGSGNPRREFLHVDDMAEACLHVMTYKGPIPDLINIGCGQDISIKELALLIKKIIGFKGELLFNSSHPDGTPRKLLDTSRIQSMGWSPSISLEDGLTSVIVDYLSKQ